MNHQDMQIYMLVKNGINHFVQNDYEEFIERFKRRILNINNLLTSGKEITFILTRPNTYVDNLSELGNTIKSKFPKLIFDFVCFDYDKYIFYKHLLLMKIDETDEEIKRLCI